MKRFFHLLFLLIYTSSCIKEVDVNIPDQEVLPVVNCIIKSDSIIKLEINSTQPIFESGSTILSDAFILLYSENMVIDTLLNNGENIFISNQITHANKEYSLEIDVNGFDLVTASDIIPEASQIRPLYYRDSVTRDVDGDLISQARIEIIDTDSERNFFELDLNALVFNESTAEFERIDLYFDTNNDLALESSGLLGSYPDTVVFTDDLFNLETYTMNINYGGIYYLFDTGVEQISFYDLVIEVRSVSENYYNYKKTLISHQETQEADVWFGIGEPLNLFSNIDNGYGIFAGFSQVTDTIHKQN
jgi:hypothetical protein